MLSVGHVLRYDPVIRKIKVNTFCRAFPFLKTFDSSSPGMGHSFGFKDLALRVLRRAESSAYFGCFSHCDKW